MQKLFIKLQYVFIIIIPIFHLADHSFADPPQFSDYHVTTEDIYTDRNHPAIKNGEYDDEDSFSQRQTALNKWTVNFAGKYIIYPTETIFDNPHPLLYIHYQIVDAATGKGYGNIASYFPKTDILDIDYHGYSKLIKITKGSRQPSHNLVTSYFVMNDGKLQYLNYFDFHKIEKDEAIFNQYCKDLNQGQKYNDSSDFICHYPHTTIKDIYKKLKANAEDRYFLNFPPPLSGKKGYNLKNDGNDGSIYYEWLSDHSLQIKIDKSIEGTTLYTIKPNSKNVTVTIHTEK